MFYQHNVNEEQYLPIPEWRSESVLGPLSRDPRIKTGLPAGYYLRKFHGISMRSDLFIARYERNILPCAKPKQTSVYRSRQDSNLRGETPMDFQSIALTTRPRLLQQCCLQLSLVKSLSTDAYQVISSCSLRNNASLISDNVYDFDQRPTYIALLGIVKKG